MTHTHCAQRLKTCVSFVLGPCDDVAWAWYLASKRQGADPKRGGDGDRGGGIEIQRGTGMSRRGGGEMRTGI